MTDTTVTQRTKTCATCAHRNGGMAFGRCMLSGFYIEIERKIPTLCDVNFSGWKQREPLLKRFQLWLYKA